MKNISLSVLLGVFSSLLASFILFLINKIDLRGLIEIVLFGCYSSVIINYLWLLRHTGIRKIWTPLSRKPLTYKITDAKRDYFVAGVTLHSMLEITGIGIDIEKLPQQIPAGLNIRLLILHPDSPFFAERITIAHPDMSPSDAIAQKKEELTTVISKMKDHFGDSVDIRFYDSYPAWWIQMIDSHIIYFSTQTNKSHIGQTYPFALELRNEHQSELYRQIEELVDITWKHAIKLRKDKSIPALNKPT